MSYNSLGRSFTELVADRDPLSQLEQYADVVERITTIMSEAMIAGKRVYWCGNGGSAAQAQHLAAEFSGRFLRERGPLPSESLTVNTSTLTAIGNDFGYDEVFSRQVRAFVGEGDVVIALTTSGKSQNLINALVAARDLGAWTVALTGNGGGPIASVADFSVVGPSSYSGVVQEVHLVIGHILCDLVEQQVLLQSVRPQTVAVATGDL